MLKTLRKNTHVIVWAVIAAFVLWGGYSASTQLRKESLYAGKVFGKNVPIYEYNLFEKAVRLFSLAKQKIDDPALIRNTAWESLILSREAKSKKITVSDAEVRKQIATMMSQYGVQPSSYLQWVEKGLRETPQEFETQVREILRIQKLVDQFTQPFLADPAAVEKEAFALHEKQNSLLSAQALEFKTSQEAEAFSRQAATEELWKAEILKASLTPQIIELSSLETLGQKFGLSGLDLSKLSEVEVKKVTPPVLSLSGNYLLFLIQDKQAASNSEFEKHKAALISSVQEQKKNLSLFHKIQEIVDRAELQDYQTPPSAN